MTVGMRNSRYFFGIGLMAGILKFGSVRPFSTELMIDGALFWIYWSPSSSRSTKVSSAQPSVVFMISASTMSAFLEQRILVTMAKSPFLSLQKTKSSTPPCTG